MTLPLRSLTLTVTSRCNLRCRYCYVPKDDATSMSGDVADAAVDLLLSESEGEPTIQIAFFGGEPFLEPELMRRAVARARSRAAPGREIAVMSPTNGLALDAPGLAFARAEAMELVISIDGDSRPSDRCDAAGRDTTDELVARLPELLELAPRCRLVARMTVTPTNAARLSAHVRALYRLGFERIVYQPAYEREWPDDAVAAWKREHGRIGTWLVGLASAGRRLPDLGPWKAIEHKMLLGRQRAHCGAGVRVAAVATDGTLYPCYRFAAEQARAYRLGDVRSGFTEVERLAELAALEPGRLRPELGDCASCASRDGCGHFCPATGALLAGDLLAVPSVVCRLVRAQVEAIRPYAALERRPRTASRWSKTLLAAAMAGAAAASCGGKEDGPSGAGDAQVTPDGSALSDASDAYLPEGPVTIDGGGGGVCPVQVDSGIGPGICAPAIDAGGGGGGLCNVFVDSSIGPGVCVEQPDSGSVGGICR